MYWPGLPKIVAWLNGSQLQAALLATLAGIAHSQYHSACSALESLSLLLGKTGWEAKLQLLNDADKWEIAEVEGGETEGRKTLSWILKIVGVVGADNDHVLHESLCVELHK